MEQEGNGQKCWQINPNCQRAKLAGENPKVDLACPAYDEKKNCWKVNWAAHLKDRPESQRGCWKAFYNVGCCECPVCEHYPEQVESMVNNINQI